jgi:serine/threonine-protein kinase
MDFREGTRVAKYLLLRPLGAGGMGTVFEAVDERLGRRVALKLLHQEGLKSDRAWRNVMHECRILAELNHPNVVHLYDADITADGVPYFVMELVIGHSLRLLCEAFCPLEVFDALAFAVQICEGLRAAHKANVIHCDLKPDNVVATTAGQVKIVDFGLARNIERAAVGTTDRLLELKGTPHYMAPEQHRGGRASAAGDIFAAGQILVEMLTGKWAFQRSTEDIPSKREAAKLICEAEPVSIVELRGEFLTGVEEIARRMLAKDPIQRPSAEEALDALQTQLAVLQVDVPQLSERPLTSEVRLLPAVPLAASRGRESLPAVRGVSLPSLPAPPRLSEKLRVFLTQPHGSPRGSMVSVAEVAEPPAAETPAAVAATPPRWSAPAPSPRPSAPAPSPRPSAPAPSSRSFFSGSKAAAPRPMDTTPRGLSASPPPGAPLPRATTERRERRRGIWLGLALGPAGAVLAFAAWLLFVERRHATAEPPATVSAVAASDGEDAGAADAEAGTAGNVAPGDAGELDAGAPASATAADRPVEDAGRSGVEDAGPGTPAHAASAAAVPTGAAGAKKPARKAPDAPPGQRLCDFLGTGCASDLYCDDYPSDLKCVRRAPTAAEKAKLLAAMSSAAPPSATAPLFRPQETPAPPASAAPRRLPSNAAPRPIHPPARSTAPEPDPTF